MRDPEPPGRGSGLVEEYERLRARRPGERGWGVALLRRQGLAAWMDAAGPFTQPRPAGGEKPVPRPASARGPRPCAGLVPILAELVLARVGGERSC